MIGENEMTNMLGTVLEPGAKYEIIYKNGTQRYPRSSVLTFLTMDRMGNYVFSARPLAGTQSFDHHFVSDIISVTRVSHTRAHHLNRIMKDGPV